MNVFKKSALAVTVASVVTLTGCAGTHSPKTQKAMDRVEEQVEGGYEQQVLKYKPVRDKIGQVHRGQAYHNVNDYSLVQEDNRVLPSVFDSEAFVYGKDNEAREFTVDEFSSFIYQAFGVMVDVSSPDLESLDKTAKDKGPAGLRAASQQASSQAGITGDSTGNYDAVRDLIGTPSQGTDRDNLKLKKFKYDGTLKGLMDYVSQMNGLKWKYDADFNKAYMYAYETRTFEIFDFGDDVNTQTQITTSTTQDSESTSGGSNKQFTRKNQVDSWKEIQESIEQMVSKEYGRATYNSKHGLITVTDSDYNLANIKRYVDKLNDVSTTEIVVDFRVIRFQYSDGDNHGINQTYLNDKLQNNLLGSFDLSFGAGTLSPNISGNLGAFQELMGGNVLSIATQSQEFLMGFLNTIGTAEVAYETQVEINNNGTYNDQDQQSEEYIASIERQNFLEGSGQENLTTERDVGVDGVNLSMKARVVGDKIQLAYALGNSDFIGLKDAGLGAGLEGVKLKTQGSLNLDHEITLVNGLPKVVKFTHRKEETTNSQGMFDDALWFLGGSEDRTESKSAIIVTVTAYYNN